MPDSIRHLPTLRRKTLKQDKPRRHACWRWLASLAAANCFLLLLLLPAAAGAIPAVQEITAPRYGVTAWLAGDPSLPVFSLTLAFTGAGAASDPEGQEGRASLAARLLPEGAGDMDALAFRRALQERAIKLEFSADEDHLYATLRALSAHKERALELLALALTRPRFDGAAVERARAEALTGLRQLGERPRYVAHRELRARLFPGHPYGRPAEGTERALAALDRERLAALPASYFSRRNLVIAAAGDISAPELAALLDRYFGALPAETSAAADGAREAEPAWFADAATVERAVPQAAIAFALPAVKRGDPDFYALYLMNHMLGGGTLTSRLAEAIREKKGLAYHVSSAVDILRNSQLIAGRFGTRNEQAREAVATLREVLRGAVERGFSQEELDNARRYVTGSFPLQLDGSGQLADYVLNMRLHSLGRDYLDKRNGYFNAVTLADVARVAERTLALHPPAIVIVGQPGAPGAHGDAP